MPPNGVAVNTKLVRLCAFGDGVVKVAVVFTKKSENSAVVNGWIVMVQIRPVPVRYMPCATHCSVDVEVGDAKSVYVAGEFVIVRPCWASATETEYGPSPPGSAVNVNPVLLCNMGGGVVSAAAVVTTKSEKNEFVDGRIEIVQMMEESE